MLRRPRTQTRTVRRSRSGRGRAGSIHAAAAMRDAAGRRCGPGKGADGQEAPHGPQRPPRRPQGKAARSGRREASARGDEPRRPLGKKSPGQSDRRELYPLAWGRESRGYSAPGMPAGMGSRAGGGEGGSYPAEPTSAARPPRGRPGARPGIRGRATVARAGRRMERRLHMDWNRSRPPPAAGAAPAPRRARRRAPRRARRGSAAAPSRSRARRSSRGTPSRRGCRAPGRRPAPQGR